MYNMYMNKKEIIVKKNSKISVLLQDFGFSYSDVNKILREKDVKINGKATKENLSVCAGDVLTVFYTDDMIEKKYETVFESENVLIVYKNQDIETDGENGLAKKLGVKAVHRLDRNTEGLVIFAKNNVSEEKLLNVFKKRLVHKYYVAEVVGEFDVKNAQFDAYLVKDSDKSFVKIYKNRVPNSVLIKTCVDTIKCGKQSSLVKVELLTGKTHQIRAHLAYLGHPIIGDGKYGKESDNKKFNQTKQKLACFCLKFDEVGIKEIDNKSFTRKPKWYI